MEEADHNELEVRAFWDTVAMGVTAPAPSMRRAPPAPLAPPHRRGSILGSLLSGSGGGSRERGASMDGSGSGIDLDGGGLLRTIPAAAGGVAAASQELAKSTTAALRKMSAAATHGQKHVNQREQVEKLLVTEKTLEGSGLLNPLGTRKLIWDNFIACLIVYSTIFVPWNWAFGLEMNGNFKTLDLAVDCVFLLDIGLTFNTAIVDHTTELLVLDRAEIVTRYLSFWFWIDFFASFPFDLVLQIAIFDKFTVFRALRIVRTLRTLRILKLITSSSSMQRSKRLEKMHISVSFVHLIRFVLVMLFIAHILACAWIYVGKVDGTEGWIYRSPSGSIGDYSDGELYITAVYFVLATMFSIGFGDFTPVTELEKGFAIGLQFMGGLTFGTILAEATRIVNSTNPQAKIRNIRMDELQLYLMERNLPIKLKAEIKEAFEYYLNEKSVFNESKIMSELPLLLRIKLVGHIFHKELKSFDYLLSPLHKGFVAQILVNIKPYQCGIGDVIMFHGEVPTDIHFINKGVVRLSAKTFVKRAGVAKVEVVIGFSTEKGYFGDLEYYRGTNRFVDYIASAPCNCFTIDTSVIDDAGVSFGKSLGKLMSEFKSRSDTFMEAKKSDPILLQGSWVRSMFWDNGKIVDLHKENAANAGRKPSVLNRRRGSVVNVGDKNMYLSPLDATQSTTQASTSSARVRMIKLTSLEEPAVICDDEVKLDLLKRGILMPRNQFKTAWDKLIAFLLLISTVIIPLQVAYYPSNIGLSHLMFIFDLIFCVDVVINFRVAYLDAEKNIIAIPSEIAKNYAQGWLAFDVITSIPYDAIINASAIDERYITLVKAVRYFKLIKFLRITKLRKRESSLQEVLGANSVAFEVGKLLFQFFVVAHVVCCLYWIYCTSFGDKHWYDVYDLEHASPRDQYIYTLYFVVATLSTVGYGDIVPHTPYERLAVVCICFMAGSVMGYIVAKITAAMNIANASERSVQEKLLEVEGYLSAKHVSSGLRALVLEQSYHKYTHASDDREEEILDVLPNLLVRQIISIHHASDIRSILLFKHIKNDSMCLYIFRKMTSAFYGAGDVIFQSGVVATEIVFLVKGEVSISQKEKRVRSRSPPEGGPTKTKSMASILALQRAKSRFLKAVPSAQQGKGKSTESKKVDDSTSVKEETPSVPARPARKREAVHVQVASVHAPGVLGLASMMKAKAQDIMSRAYIPCTCFNLEESVILEILDHSPPLSLALRDAFAKLIIDERALFQQNYRQKRYEFFARHWSRAAAERKKKSEMQSLARIASNMRPRNLLDNTNPKIMEAFRTAMDVAQTWAIKTPSSRDLMGAQKDDDKTPAARKTPSNTPTVQEQTEAQKRRGSRATLTPTKKSVTTCDLDQTSAAPNAQLDARIQLKKVAKKPLPDIAPPQSPVRMEGAAPTTPRSHIVDILDAPLTASSPNRIMLKPLRPSSSSSPASLPTRAGKDSLDATPSNAPAPAPAAAPARAPKLTLGRMHRSHNLKIAVDSTTNSPAKTPSSNSNATQVSVPSMNAPTEQKAQSPKSPSKHETAKDSTAQEGGSTLPKLSIKLPIALKPVSSESTATLSATAGVAAAAPAKPLMSKAARLQRVKSLMLLAASEEKKKEEEEARKSGKIPEGEPKRKSNKEIADDARKTRRFSFLATRWKELIKPRYVDLSKRQVGLYDSDEEEPSRKRRSSLTPAGSSQIFTNASSASGSALTPTAFDVTPPARDIDSSGGRTPAEAAAILRRGSKHDPSTQHLGTTRPRALSDPFETEVEYIAGPSKQDLYDSFKAAELNEGLQERHPLERLVHPKSRRRMSFPSPDIRDWKELNISEFMV